jgi:hypothetical protein
MMNYANYDYGVRLVDYSSEMIDCEANNVLDNKMNTIWLSGEGLPQWLCLSLVNLHNVRNIVLRTIGWHCWHPYSTNPKVVILHVSADGSKFKQWDTFYATGPQKGSQLFCCAPISCSLYPFLAFEITEVFGGNQTYMNRLYLYSEEITSSPAVSDTSQRSAGQLSMISSSQHDSIETNSVLQKLEAALGLNDTSSLSDDHQPTQSLLQPSTTTPGLSTHRVQVDDNFSDMDSDSLPLTLTLDEHKNERVSERISIISRLGSQNTSVPEVKRIEVQSHLETENQKRIVENQSMQINSPISEQRSEAPESAVQTKSPFEGSTSFKSHTDNLETSRNQRGPEDLQSSKEMSERADLLQEHHEVSSLTISRVEEKRDEEHSFQKIRDVSIRISDLEGKMDSLMKAFELLRSSEGGGSQTSLSVGKENSREIPPDPAIRASLSMTPSDLRRSNTEIVASKKMESKEPMSSQPVLESENEESDTADTLSLTSNLSTKRTLKRSKDDLVKREHSPQKVGESSHLENTEELNTSNRSLNRSSTTTEAIHVVRSLESLLRTIIPTQRGLGSPEVKDEQKSVESLSRVRLDSPPRSRTESTGHTIYPQPSRASPLQPCLVTSHSPSKGPGGVFRREKIHYPLHSVSVASSTSTSCSCAYTSLPTRINPVHLDHPTPLLPPNLNLPVPFSHHRSCQVQEESQAVHSSSGVGRVASLTRIEQSESIDELVEKLHQKILERTLKEAELALIRKTKRELQNEPPAPAERHQEKQNTIHKASEIPSRISRK